MGDAEGYGTLVIVRKVIVRKKPVLRSRCFVSVREEVRMGSRTANQTAPVRLTGHSTCSGYLF